MHLAVNLTVPFIYSSVCQTNSASTNLSLNIQGHVEVPKSIFFLNHVRQLTVVQIRNSLKNGAKR